MSGTTSIYTALNSVALGTHRVVNPRSIPGTVKVDADHDIWRELDGHAAGCLRLFTARTVLAGTGFATNIVVVFTRALVDNGVDLTPLGAHFFNESRGLPHWREEQAVAWPPAQRHSGWSMQSGTYTEEDLRSIRSRSMRSISEQMSDTSCKPPARQPSPTAPSSGPLWTSWWPQ